MREMSNAEWRVSVVIMVVLVVGMFLTLALVVGVGGEDPTCPNYGEVPALIDGGYECIEWGQP